MDVSYRKLCRQIVGPQANNGRNLVWTTSSTSAGFRCRVNVLQKFCYVFTFHLFFTPVLRGARHFLEYRLDSARLRLKQPHCVQAIQRCIFCWMCEAERRQALANLSNLTFGFTHSSTNFQGSSARGIQTNSQKRYEPFACKEASVRGCDGSFAPDRQYLAFLVIECVSSTWVSGNHQCIVSINQFIHLRTTEAAQNLSSHFAKACCKHFFPHLHGH